MRTYWHIAESDKDGIPRLGHGDGREIKVGETLTAEGELVLCEHGLHACSELYDCLNDARGTVICKVTLGDEVMAPGGENKVVSNARTVVAMTTAAEGERVLREFARWCALQVIDLWDAPNVVRRYLETGDESLQDAAYAAAYAAASAVARDVAWDAAYAAASAAARTETCAAAWAAAWAVGWSSASAVARDVAWDAAYAAAYAAARAVGWDAAWDAKMAEFRAKLVEMVEPTLQTD